MMEKKHDWQPYKKCAAYAARIGIDVNDWLLKDIIRACEETGAWLDNETMGIVFVEVERV